MNELVSADFVVLVKSNCLDISFSHLKIARSLCEGAVESSHLAAETLAEVLEACAYHKAALRECRLCTSIDNLEEKLAHCSVDCIAHEVGIESLKNCLSRKNFRSHSGRMSHARASDSLDKSFLDDSVLDIKGQLAGTLLRSTPADAMCKSRDVSDFLCLYPFSLLWNRSRTMVRSFFDATHLLHFVRINHNLLNKFCSN